MAQYQFLKEFQGAENRASSSGQQAFRQEVGGQVLPLPNGTAWRRGAIEFAGCETGLPISPAPPGVYLRRRSGEAAKRDELYDGISVLVTTVPPSQASADVLFTKFKQQNHCELANHQWKTPLAVHPIFLKSPRRVEALVFLMMIALTAYYLLQRMYRQTLPARASVKQRRTTTETILRAFSKYTLNLQRSRYGRIVYPTRLSARQREILVQLGFPTPAQILYRRLARPPPD